MGGKEEEILVFLPKSRRRLRLTSRGLTFDVLLLTLTFSLFALGTLPIINPTQFHNLLNYFRCGSKSSSQNTTVPNVLVSAPQCDVTFDSDRFDCWPETKGAAQQACEARGCCWDTNVGQGVPTCFYPRVYNNSYRVTSLQNTTHGMEAVLQRSTQSPYPGDVIELKLEVTYETNERLRFRIFDPNSKRYEVPIDLHKGTEMASNPDYKVSLSVEQFAITIRRISTGEIMFDSSGVSQLIFSDQFIQIGTKLATSNVYGLGEHRSSLKLDTEWTKIVFWARDQAPTLDENLYGSHPFFMNLDGKNNAHGVFLLNSNAMEVDLQPSYRSSALTYRSIGGILDFYVFLGPTPDAVVRQYVNLIGKPFFPPFWSFGFHLCKYGYTSSTELKKVIDRNRAANIPYDVQWNDIDYMSSHLDWTYDNTTYTGLPDIVDDLHRNDQKYVIIVDPGISSVQTLGSYPPYDEGVEDDIFVKAHNGSNLQGKVWPGQTVFPDFLNPNASDWWYRQAKRYHDVVSFDGLWTDMNEPSNFVDGSISGCTNNSLDNPPFIPPVIDGSSLFSRTLCPSAQHHISSHYNVHSMYGFSEVRASMGVLNQLKSERSIVISRSTFPSSGRYGGHWLGDNRSGWPDLYYSIPGIINFQMFGIPFVGADICGFGGDTTPELCTRWMQVGAFYPFMRNHDALGQKDQDPGAFDSVTQGYMRSVLQTRYLLLPYLYSLFFRNHIQGTPVVRPLFFQYPGEASEVDKQFLWGTSLLISPVLEEGATSVPAYFPSDVWYDFYNGSRLSTAGESVLLDAPLSKINLHVRGGSVLPIKPASTTTAALRIQSFSLIVALASDGSAKGEVYWDDGKSLDSVEKEKYSLVTFSVAGKILESTVLVDNYDMLSEMKLDGITIFGVTKMPNQVLVNNVAVTSQYDNRNQVLKLQGLSVSLLQPLRVNW
ncbi:LOW QUALITY PROTEIN: lysosomal alpha-glucosidase-like [Haliotis cracherodii]|uniref:LOW QUALITY PROTEIN: lysosomal alpha-glucosidase-like n=1 Tax=Haliotis cracherodii TaxID=6455 RepID=UPI0039E77659